MRWLPLLALLLGISAAAGRAAEAPAKGRIVYPRQVGTGYRLHIMNADGTGDRELPGQTANVNYFPSWSPDGKRIAFTSSPAVGEEQLQVSLINADGTNLRSLNGPSQRAGLPAWSPDGKQLAFAAGDQRPQVYVSDAEGNGIRRLSPEEGAGFAPFWLRDGKRIGYSKFAEQPQGRIVLVGADGTGEETLPPQEGLLLAGPNALSPDGKTLLFVSMDMATRKGSLRSWTFEGGVENRIIDVEQPDPQIQGLPLPAWAPDGKSYLLNLPTDKGTALFRISADGNQKTRLTPEGVNCLAGAWTAAE
jgi:TolB protein